MSNYQQRQLDQAHLREELGNDRHDRYESPRTESQAVGLFKITSGPELLDGKYLYKGRRQRYDDGLVDRNDTDVYLWFPNNIGTLPTDHVVGHYHIAINIGWWRMVDEIAVPVWISTELLGKFFYRSI